MSFSSPKRPSGIRLRRRLRASSLVQSIRSSGVSIGPGQMALQRIPSLPYCTAKDFVNESIPPLETVYASCGTVQPIKATNDATLMIEPPLPCFTIGGIAYFEHKKALLRLTSITLSQSSSEISVTLPSSDGIIPALL